MIDTIITKRLILRPWKVEDHEPFAIMNADPRVMEHFPAPLTREQSDLMVKRTLEMFEVNGWGRWAVEVPGVAPFIGFIGLSVWNKENSQLEFAPCVEVGWRLAHEHWGKGYASEGALACLEYGFERLNLPEIVSFTALTNTRSMKVMEKIGMHREVKDDFNHPNLPLEHPLCRHVLYRLSQQEWKQTH